MSKVIRGDQIFENLLGDINYSNDSFASQLYPFKVRVGVVKLRPPRHEFFEFIIDMGYLDIDRILQKKSLKGKTKLTFVFPERWMGVQETSAFMHLLVNHPEVSKIKQVDILTSSPMMISNFAAEQIRILTWDGDEKYERYSSTCSHETDKFGI